MKRVRCDSWHFRLGTALALALVVFAPNVARAERVGTIEVSGGGGWRVGGDLKGRKDKVTGDELSDLHFESSASYGASIGRWMRPDTQFEILWSRQSTNVTNPKPYDGEAPIDVDVVVDDFLAGLLRYSGRAYDRRRWFGGVHAGLTKFGFEHETEHRFAMGASAGLRVRAATRARLRLHVRSRWAYLNRKHDFLLDDEGLRWRFPRSNWAHEWDFGAKLGFLF